MKKAATFILAVLVFTGITSCQKAKDNINKATEFDMNYSTEVSIPSSTLTAPQGTTQPIDFNTPEISTQSTSRFSSESTTKDLITEIKLTKFTISNPKGNLSFLRSISIYLKSSGKDDILIATKTNIPDNSTSVDADVKDVNIKDYIFKDKIQFRVNVTLVTSTGSKEDQTLKTSQTMHVKGKKI
jgi:hypothetical protein